MNRSQGKVPSVKERIGSQILVNAHLVGERVVLVVLVRLPRDSQSVANRRKHVEFIGPFVNSVDVNLSQLSSLCAGEGFHFVLTRLSFCFFSTAEFLPPNHHIT